MLESYHDNFTSGIREDGAISITNHIIVVRTDLILIITLSMGNLPPIPCRNESRSDGHSDSDNEDDETGLGTGACEVDADLALGSL